MKCDLHSFIAGQNDFTETRTLKPSNNVICNVITLYFWSKDMLSIFGWCPN